jgi:hypothetical protein
METQEHDPIAFLNRLYKETGYLFDDIALYNIRDNGFRCNSVRLNIKNNKDNTIVMIKLQPISNIPVIKIKKSIHITIGVFKDVEKNYLKKQGYEMMRDILGEDILIRDLLLVGHISHSCSLVINSNNSDSASIYNFVISFRNRYLKNAIVSSFFPVHISFAHFGVAELLKKHQNIQNINDVQEEQAIRADVPEQVVVRADVPEQVVVRADVPEQIAVQVDVQEQEVVQVDVQEQEVVQVDVQEQEVVRADVPEQIADQEAIRADVQEANRDVERVIRVMPNIIDRALQYRTNAIDRAMQSRMDVQPVQTRTNTDVRAVQTTNQASSQTTRTPLNTQAPIFYPNRVYRCCVVYPVYQYY